jgi:hypothetical protein
MVGGMRQKLGLLNRVAAEVGLEFHVLGEHLDGILERGRATFAISIGSSCRTSS